MSLRARIERLRGVMGEHQLDALVVSSLSNIRYLTGFSGSNALCIIRRGESMFVTDARYALQCREEVRGWKCFVAAGSLLELVSKKRFLARCRRIGFESQHTTYAQYRTLKRLFPTASIRPTADVVEGIALTKEKDEIAAIEEAAAISDKVFQSILGMIAPGVRELDIAMEISRLHRTLGADRDAFDAIVASGVRGALPHARAGAKRLRAGELVTLDFGCTVRGYNSDLTRTVAVGRASRKARAIYAIVLEAQRAAIAAARGGMWARDLDAVARRLIRAHGYGNRFIHSLGHGLGLHVHELPRVSALSKDKLRAGSVITVEPGIYINGFGGVRIEDDLVLTETGCRVLTRSPKEFIIV